MSRLFIIPFLLFLTGCDLDLGVVGGTIVATWIAWNFWYLVPGAVLFGVGIVLWKVVITPKEYHERLAYEQTKENKKMSIPRARRIGVTVLIWIFAALAISFSGVAFYKIITD